MTQCSVIKCKRPSYARTYCASHYDWAANNDWEKPTHEIGLGTRQRGVKLSSANWTRENLAWAAGIIEGEGCWKSVKVNSGTLAVVMTDEDTILKLKDVIGGGSIKTRILPSGKTAWVYTLCTGRAVYAIAVAVWPWMSKRRRQQIRTMLANMKILGVYP
jgi:hypothetical protein